MSSCELPASFTAAPYKPAEADDYDHDSYITVAPLCIFRGAVVKSCCLLNALSKSYWHMMVG